MTTSTTRRGRFMSWMLGGALCLAVLAVSGFVLPTIVWSGNTETLFEEDALVTVRRASVDVELVVPGEIESAENTLIECELERLRERSAGGQRISTSGRAKIIEIVPPGSSVQEGEILCRLESAEVEEMIRQKQIEVDQARSELLQAKTDLEQAQIALEEYVSGTRLQQYQEMESQIALATSEFERQKDRLDWADKMIKQGYITPARREQEAQALLSAEINLENAKATLENYKRYTEPKETQTLENDVDSKMSRYLYMQQRYDRQEERLAHYKSQLEACTVRAPHDGVVVYVQDDDDDEVIQVGTEVHRRMDLFKLPNLEKLIVRARVNQTLLNRLKVGMPVQVSVSAFSDRTFKGRLEKVESLPRPKRHPFESDDVKEYDAIIALEESEGLRPEMDASARILTKRYTDTLIVPTQAVLVKDHQEFCFVLGPNGVETRLVEVKPGSIDTLNVLSGLREGERVIADPAAHDLLETIETPGSPASLASVADR